MNHAQMDHSFTGLDGSFIVFAISSIPSEPLESALDNPTLGQQHEPNRVHRSQDCLQNPAEGLSYSFRQYAFATRRVGPNHLQASKLAVQAFDHTTGTVVILHRSRMDHHGQDQTERIHGNVTLAPTTRPVR